MNCDFGMQVNIAAVAGSLAQVNTKSLLEELEVENHMHLALSHTTPTRKWDFVLSQNEDDVNDL